VVQSAHQQYNCKKSVASTITGEYNCSLFVVPFLTFHPQLGWVFQPSSIQQLGWISIPANCQTDGNGKKTHCTETLVEERTVLHDWREERGTEKADACKTSTSPRGNEPMGRQRRKDDRMSSLSQENEADGRPVFAWQTHHCHKQRFAVSLQSVLDLVLVEIDSSGAFEVSDEPIRDL
jgi:hypothetical protein